MHKHNILVCPDHRITACQRPPTAVNAMARHRTRREYIRSIVIVLLIRLTYAAQTANKASSLSLVYIDALAIMCAVASDNNWRARTPANYAKETGPVSWARCRWSSVCVCACVRWPTHRHTNTHTRTPHYYGYCVLVNISDLSLDNHSIAGYDWPNINQQAHKRQPAKLVSRSRKWTHTSCAANVPLPHRFDNTQRQ